MVRDGRKISTGRLYKVGVEESNGDVISAVGRHLAAETNFQSNPAGLKISVNLLKVTDRRKTSM
jgi:hypothetical protein